MLEVEYSKPWTTKSVKQRHEMKLERKNATCSICAPNIDVS